MKHLATHVAMALMAAGAVAMDNMHGTTITTDGGDLGSGSSGGPLAGTGIKASSELDSAGGDPGSGAIDDMNHIGRGSSGDGIYSDRSLLDSAVATTTT
jgi:hypothetical protein